MPCLIAREKAGVHVWVKDIQRLANLTNRSFPESAAEEIHFWSSIGEALEMTNTELRWTTRQHAVDVSSSVDTTLMDVLGSCSLFNMTWHLTPLSFARSSLCPLLRSPSVFFRVTAAGDGDGGCGGGGVR